MTHSEAMATEAAERYLLDEMTENEEYAFERHYFDCKICFDKLRAGFVFLIGVSSLYAGTAVRSAPEALQADQKKNHAGGLSPHVIRAGFVAALDPPARPPYPARTQRSARSAGAPRRR